ncbi:molybdate ABC transporter substrate-binding protein [Peribacillus sp. SCS-155]|uniref:molybdate ABC transporter substrate-binding protein n=1 Tax=Peribacillus sedimenti TaxID=3115297 RepID=UPI003906C315
MLNRYLVILSTVLLFLTLSGCSANERVIKEEAGKQEGSEKKVELTISAAASLQDALKEIKAAFQEEHPNVKVNFNFGASGALQQQINQGAPVDLFFSAAEDKFDKLVQDGQIDQKKSTDLVGNELVLVVPMSSNKKIKSFEDLANIEKIAIGTPEAVPAGQYAKETLENINIWKSVEGSVVFAKDVRQVLTYVETNNVDAGIVYKTDAMISKKVKVAATAKENTHAPIIYPVGVVKNTEHLKQALLFYDYLQNEKSMSTLEKYGFTDIN